jgi:AraC-like DNA-binding protein
MNFDLLTIISLFTFIQLSFLTIVTFNYKKGKKLSNRILSGFLASNALLIAHPLLWSFHWISSESNIIILAVGNSLYLLLAPFLYLYFQSLCYKEFHLKAIHLLHLVPFFITITFYLFVKYYSRSYGYTETSESSIKSFLQIEFWSRKILLHFQIFLYIIASVHLLTSYRKNLKDLFSSIEKIDLSWCNLILIAFAVMWFLDLSNWMLSSLHIISGLVSHWLFFSSLMINLTFTLAVTYKGLTQSESLLGIQGYQKYITSRLKRTDCEVIVQKLTKYMTEEKPYLTPSLSVEDLSIKLKIPPKQLSQAIHTCLNKNFYDFINSYRIDKAKELVNSENYRNQTLLALAYDVGFNSKSVFNSAFKKYTGLTPKEFKLQSNS